ncbi:MAG: alcohol dehydrogenase [Zestosphaera tikiterensis]|uniref:Alcohol dehydrogenase n=1 Tax=Zestosphaera tikiterensis TaxID=1973259 RepID=A0A2R7Y5S0_9CREN|nr:MAG: alcohol dehydrogenase [Zestosphaera tikiterensis]
MRAAVLKEHSEVFAEGLPRRYPNLPLKEEPLDLEDLPTPEVGPNQVLIRVKACGVCYTDIDIIEGRVECSLPLVLGHQIVGRVEEVGFETKGRVKVGDRVGVAWIGWSCGTCRFCRSGLENLCSEFKGTGCHINGGYAEYTTAYEDFTYLIPSEGGLEDYEIAPLLCAGAVGYRALKLADVRDGFRLGLFGFGASAHIITQVVRKLYPSVEIYVFSRSEEHRDLARKLGAEWAGHPQENPPKKLDRAIDFTPVGEMVSRALELLERGGKLVINVIRKQTPTNLDYVKHLWMEREVKSVANVTRKDVKELLSIALKNNVKPEVKTFKLEEVNKALKLVKGAKIRGSAVLLI